MQHKNNSLYSLYSSCVRSLIVRISNDQEKNECVPSFHVSAYAFVVDDLTELNSVVPLLFAFKSLA